MITSAGVILAGTFSVLMTLPVTFTFDLGLMVALGILLDTFIVRTIMVPGRGGGDRRQDLVALDRRGPGAESVRRLGSTRCRSPRKPASTDDRLPIRAATRLIRPALRICLASSGSPLAATKALRPASLSSR